MSSRSNYKPGPATGATVDKQGDTWTLVLVRELRHTPKQVWEALTDPTNLREWAPFDADRNMGTVGKVTLSTVGTPTPQASETEVTCAQAPHLLQYRWGDNEMRWQLEPYGTGTRLTLWHSIDRRYIAMGAAGWHICIDVLDRLLGEQPLGRIVGAEAMKHDWLRLNTEYAKQFGMEPQKWPPTSGT
ncbi:SRPBCC family protein [Dyella sp.]|uniref:SRPBCC family protein n=1 Tax=Dyella sp. TaxID=1869338 RepID=UPI002ED119F7